MKFTIKYFFSKYEKNRRKLRICSHFLKKYLIENFIFCAVKQIKTHSALVRINSGFQFDILSCIIRLCDKCYSALSWRYFPQNLDHSYVSF